MEYKLRELCKIGSSKRIYLSEYKESGIPFYRGKEIIEKSNGTKNSPELFISLEKYEEIKSKFSVPKMGDILISAVGTLGKSWFVDEENFYFKDGNLVWLYDFDNEIINNKFLYYKLTSKWFENIIDGISIGSTQKAITIEQLRKVELVVPNIETQNKIVKILDGISKKIELNNKINDNLYNILNSLFKCWFEDYNSYKKDELVVTEIGNIPKDFKVIELDELISIRGGLAYKASKLSENTQDNILISMGNVELNKLFNFNNLKYYSEDVGSKYIANAGDLFICTRDVTQQRNQLGCPGIIPKIFEDRNVIIGTNLYIVDYKKNDKNLNKYLFLLLNSTRYRERIVGSAKGTAILMISKDDVLKFKFAFPKNEQILNKFNKIINPLFDKIENNICENNELEQLRDILLPKLMNGEIDLNEIEIE